MLGRIRAGVLEQVTVDLLDEAGVGARMHAEGLLHDGIELLFGGARHRIDLHGLTGGKQVMVYGQTEVTRDLMDARAARPACRPSTRPSDVSAARLRRRRAARDATRKDGAAHELDCDFIAGCDGYHGVSRAERAAGGAARPTSGSIRSAGSACCRTRRRSRTS